MFFCFLIVCKNIMVSLVVITEGFVGCVWWGEQHSTSLLLVVGTLLIRPFLPSSSRFSSGLL